MQLCLKNSLLIFSSLNYVIQFYSKSISNNLQLVKDLFQDRIHLTIFWFFDSIYEQYDQHPYFRIVVLLAFFFCIIYEALIILSKHYCKRNHNLLVLIVISNAIYSSPCLLYMEQVNLFLFTIFLLVLIFFSMNLYMLDRVSL